MRKLRPYQEKALRNFTKWFNSNKKLSTIILPTGTGKTFSAVSCIKSVFDSGKKIKVLWAAHREELINQAYLDFTGAIDNINIQKEMAEYKADPSADIVVGSVQTLSRNRKHMSGFVPDIIIIDEYHHYHEKNTQYQGLLDKYPNAKVLGLTATPYRFIGGDIPLGEVLVEMDIGTAIAKGYLVPPKPEALKTNVSIAHVKTLAGDFSAKELAEAINVEERNKLIADRVIKAVKEEGRKGILYAASVDHSKAMAKILEEAGLKVAEIYGETDKEERRETIESIKSGEIDILVNNLVAVEGFDLPIVDFIVMARPTKSLGLMIQCLGRGLRLHPDKKDCLFVDVFDLVKTTQSRITYEKVASVGDIDGSQRRFDAIMKEKIADELKNFPVVLKLNKGEMWTYDDSTWYAPSWVLDTNQWVITWSKTSERKPTGDYNWENLKFVPKKYQLKNMNVLHDIHGEGSVIDAIYGQVTYLVVDFNGDIKNVPYYELKIKQEKFESTKLKTPIKRAFYIISNDMKTKCRVLVLLKNKDSFTVQSDVVGDGATINEVIKSVANEDDIVQIVRADAKWRERDASDKQKKFIKNLMTWGKVSDNIDISSLTGGEAAAILDQVDWVPIINDFFCSSKKEELIGYLLPEDDL